MKRFLLPASTLLFLSCSGGDSNAQNVPEFSVVWEVTEGIQSPESVYWDADAGQLYVSQIADGGATAKDGDGYISKMTPDGKMVQLKWITGLNAPKGLRSHGKQLWVADIDQLVRIDIGQGKMVERIDIPGAQFLNDVACDAKGAVYVSDTLNSKIFRYADGKVDVFAEGKDMECPNGLLVVAQRLVVAGWGQGTADDFTTKIPGNVFSLDLGTAKKSSITGKPLGNLDGLETVAEGRFLVSDWMTGTVYYVNTDGLAREILQLPKGAADIGYVPDEQLLIVPQMLENKLTAYRLRRPEPRSSTQP